jgi:tetratricopeptide (TPR) repeat protein
MELSITQAVAQVLRSADQALTLAELLARARLLRPVDTAKPEATIRVALGSLPLVVSLGGRPARYVWWPHSLAGNCFRQPLADWDPTSGQVMLCEEVRLALWPTFFANPRERPYELMLVAADEVELPVQVDFIEPGPRTWGLLPNPILADWLHRQGAATGDALLIRVLDVAERRYGVELAYPARGDDAAMAARNQALADTAAQVLRDTRDDLPDYVLIPRLIVQGAYCDPLPPDPLEDVLAADGRFFGGPYDMKLAERTVERLERSMEVRSDPHAAPRPKGDYKLALNSDDEAQRRSWGEYLFDRGMDHRWVGWNAAAEAYYREAVRVDPGHADAWVHLGILRFEEDKVGEALDCYERGEQAALARTIGDPGQYDAPFWLDLDSRPYMRALHGKGLCLWRLGKMRDARQVFADMLRLNPNDNQGVRFLIPDLDAGLTWEQSMAQQEQSGV